MICGWLWQNAWWWWGRGWGWERGRGHCLLRRGIRLMTRAFWGKKTCSEGSDKKNPTSPSSRRNDFEASQPSRVKPERFPWLLFLTRLVIAEAKRTHRKPLSAKFFRETQEIDSVLFRILSDSGENQIGPRNFFWFQHLDSDRRKKFQHLFSQRRNFLKLFRFLPIIRSLKSSRLVQKLFSFDPFGRKFLQVRKSCQFLGWTFR